jgi:crotonobetainyl-CoA:carnitine CoA-transferase CaiB-like acyl-CoA transferase
LLEDIKVLELARVLAGPSVGMFLAEMGAEVIKLENYERGGDVTRSWKLPNEAEQDDVSAYFAAANWGKKSICINLSDEQGQRLVYDIMPHFDIVITSYKAGDAAKLKMDYETLKEFRKEVIYASINGYGEHDNRVAYDAVLQAESGFMSMNGTAESGPLKMPVALIDILAAHQLKEAILMALIKRLKTGEGSFVSVSLYDTAVASLANQATNALMNKYIPGLEGSLHPNIAPYGETFKTVDGRYIILAVGSNRQFAGLCTVLDIEEINNDIRFANNYDRVVNRKALAEILASKISMMESAYLLEEMQKRQIPAGMVRQLDEVLSKAAHLTYVESKYAGLRQAVYNKAPIEMSRPPHIGEHTIEVLRGLLSINEAELNLLSKEGVIGPGI